MNIIRTLTIGTIAALACRFALAQNNVGNFYTGEVKVEVVKSYASAQALPTATSVLINDFTIDPAVIAMDESAAGRMHTRLFLRRDPDDASAPTALAQQVQASFSKALIGDLKKQNITAERAGDTQDGSKGALLVVSGEVTAIDEGNKVKRVMIGLGRGGSEVQTHVVISSVVDGHSTVVLELNLKSVSGKKLGAVESVGGGSIALNAAEGDVGDRHSTVQADATRMAKGVAKQIEQFVAAQHPAPASMATQVAALPASAPSVLLAQSIQ
jgi:Domain of unknown function (DUF4410)